MRPVAPSRSNTSKLALGVEQLNARALTSVSGAWNPEAVSPTQLLGSCIFGSSPVSVRRLRSRPPMMFTNSDAVIVSISEGTGQGWAATSAHAGFPGAVCELFNGTATPTGPASVEGQIACIP